MSTTKVLPMVLVGTNPNLERLSGILYPNRTLRRSRLLLFGEFLVFCATGPCWASNSRRCCHCLVESNRVNIRPNEVTRIGCLSELLHFSLSLGGTKVVRDKVTVGSSVYLPNGAAIPSRCTTLLVNIQCIITWRHRGAVTGVFFSRAKEGVCSPRRGEALQQIRHGHCGSKAVCPHMFSYKLTIKPKSHSRKSLIYSPFLD